jgi:hypothetical protein
MLRYSFNADLREVLRRLAAADQSGGSQNRDFDEKGSVTRLPLAQPLSCNGNGGHHEPITMSCG